MSGLLTPGDRPGIWSTIGDLLKRVARLEAVPASTGGSGWQFNVDNEGGWGYVVANDSTDIDYGEYGLVFAETTENGVLLLSRDAGNFVQSLISVAVNGGVQIVDAAGVGVSVTSVNGDISLIVTGGGDISARLSTGGTFTLKDHLGAPILQMTEGSPDLHIPATGTLVADL